MAFTGTATVLKLSDSKFQITGLSLAASATGTIGFSVASGGSGAGEVDLDAPDIQPYKSEGLQGGVVSVPAGTNVQVQSADAAASSLGPQVSVTKAGTDKSDFLATITNRNSSTVTGALLITVTFG